jgi:hypothetical protein
LRSHQLRSYSRSSQHFIESEGLLPCSQELATCSILREIYPVHNPSYSFKFNFKIILPPPCLNYLSDFFPSGFPTKALYALIFYLVHAISTALLILLEVIILIIFGDQFVLRSSSLNNFVQFFTTSSVQIFSSAPRF